MAIADNTTALRSLDIVLLSGEEWVVELIRPQCEGRALVAQLYRPDHIVGGEFRGRREREVCYWRAEGETRPLGMGPAIMIPDAQIETTDRRHWGREAGGAGGAVVSRVSREAAIAALVERDVSRWGEAERAASLRLRERLSHGLALNALAHYDPEHVDSDLAAEARAVMTDADRRVLRSGG